MWRCYDWLNPRCGATNDAEGPCGVIMSVEILRGLRYSFPMDTPLTIFGLESIRTIMISFGDGGSSHI